MKSPLIIATILAALFSCHPGWTDQAAITIYPGENWISLPITPYNGLPETVFNGFPGMFSGFPIDANLTRLDTYNDTIETYYSKYPEVFGPMLLGEGFKIINETGSTWHISYDGYPDGFFAWDGAMGIDLSGNFCDGADAGGTVWIGNPYNHKVSIGGCLIDYYPAWGVPIADAIEEGWIDGLWLSYDAQTHRTFTAGPSWMSPDETFLRPGQMYELKTHRDYLSITIPNDPVAEPCGLLGLALGVGCMGLLRRRR